MNMEPHIIQNDHLRLRLHPEMGSSISELSVNTPDGWTNILMSPPSLEEWRKHPFGYGCFLMAPWCNRIQDAHFSFDRTLYRLHPNWSDGSAIHGDVASRPWLVRTRSNSHYEAVLDTTTLPDFNFPFSYLFSFTVQLEKNSLEWTLKAQNTSKVRAPVGFGFHPYFRKNADGVTLAALKLPFDRFFPSKVALPLSPAEPVPNRDQLRHGVSLVDQTFDECYLAPTGDPVVLRYHQPSFDVHLYPSGEFSHLYIYAPRMHAGKPAAFACVEPMTHAVNAFNLFERGWQETGMKILEQGEMLSGSLRIKVELKEKTA